jgi:DNA-directed RNA polymerase
MSQENELYCWLVAELARRQKLLRADRNKPTFYLKEVDPEWLLMTALQHLVQGAERVAPLSEVLCAAGRRIRQKLREPASSVHDAHAGWFVAVSLLDANVIRYRLRFVYKNGKRSKHQSYHIAIGNKERASELLATLDLKKADGAPSLEEPADWSGPTHETGRTIVKKMDSSTVCTFPRGTTDWMPYQVLNKLQKQAWRVNLPVLSVYQHMLSQEPMLIRMAEAPAAEQVIGSVGDPDFEVKRRSAIPPNKSSPFKFAKETDAGKRRSMEREALGVSRMALSFSNSTFYNVYNFDFRGRIYPNTSYLNEQSSDNSRGLLLFDKAVPLGETGYFWLSVHASNAWGNDKVSLLDRFRFTQDKLQEWCSYAKDPFHNKGWCSADSPFQFLAVCFELAAIQEHAEHCPPEVAHSDWLSQFRSRLPIYIDGSNNGVQHLTAMSGDTVVAPLVNLVPSELPGDVYMYIARFVWARIQAEASQVPPEVAGRLDEVLEFVHSRQEAYNAAPNNSDLKMSLFRELAEWRNHNRALREQLFAVYWARVTDPKKQRKIVKRNVMTLGYGGTPYGFGEQIIDDTRDLDDYLAKKESMWGAKLGRLVYQVCHEKLPGPAAMLRLFTQLAQSASERDLDLCWQVPITGFPVNQRYREATEKRIKLMYGFEEIRLQLLAREESYLDCKAQETGTPPNITHSLDAAHLCMSVAAADFNVSVVHDSYGCHAAHMGELFMLVRAKFAELYLSDPLKSILEQNDAMRLYPVKGDLDLNLIMESDYAFA